MRKIKMGGSDAASDGFAPTLDFVIGQIDNMAVSLAKDVDSVYDMYYDIQAGKFCNWRSVYLYNLEEKNLTDKRGRNLLTITIPTQGLLRTTYIMDRLLHAGKPVMLLGPSGQGKSTIMRHYLMDRDTPGPKRVLSHHMHGFCFSTTCERLRNLFESKLKTQTKTQLAPVDERKIVFMIDDMDLAQSDRYGHQRANELVRQWLDHQGWYHPVGSVYFMRVRDIGFTAALSVR